MAEIGVGSRVWLGYTENTEYGYRKAVCKTGTILDGPFGPGLIEDDDMIHYAKEECWNIQMDYGQRVCAVESVIFPIDGDEGLEDRKSSQPEIEKEI